MNVFWVWTVGRTEPVHPGVTEKSSNLPPCWTLWITSSLLVCFLSCVHLLFSSSLPSGIMWLILTLCAAQVCCQQLWDQQRALLTLSSAFIFCIVWKAPLLTALLFPAVGAEAAPERSRTRSRVTDPSVWHHTASRLLRETSHLWMMITMIFWSQRAEDVAQRLWGLCLIGRCSTLSDHVEFYWKTLVCKCKLEFCSADVFVRNVCSVSVGVMSQFTFRAETGSRVSFMYQADQSQLPLSLLHLSYKSGFRV